MISLTAATFFLTLTFMAVYWLVIMELLVIVYLSVQSLILSVLVSSFGIGILSFPALPVSWPIWIISIGTFVLVLIQAIFSLIPIGTRDVSIAIIIISAPLGLACLVLGLPEIFAELIIVTMAAAIPAAMTGAMLSIPCFNCAFAPLILAACLIVLNAEIIAIVVTIETASIFIGLFLWCMIVFTLIVDIFALVGIMVEVCILSCAVMLILTFSGGTCVTTTFAMATVFAISSGLYCMLIPILWWCFPISIPMTASYFMCMLTVIMCFPPVAVPFLGVAFCSTIILSFVIIPIMIMVFIGIGIGCASACVLSIVILSFVSLFCCGTSLFCATEGCVWSTGGIFIVCYIACTLILAVPALGVTCPAAGMTACILAPLAIIIVELMAALGLSVRDIFSTIAGLVRRQ